MAIHSSAIAWKIPWTEEPGSHGVAELDTTERLHFTSYEYGCVAFTCRTEVGLMYGYWSHSTCPPALPLWRASWFLFPNMDMLYNLFNFSLLTFRIFTSFSNRLLGPKVHTVKSLVRHWTAFQTVSCSHSRRMSVCLYLYRHCCLLALCLLLLSHFSRVRLCTTP